MNEYNANNPSEMLNLLIDGELDSSMETSLYSSLLENEELRNEMRELISLRESVRRDVEAFTPPISATQGIFTKLGYTIPLPRVSIPTAVSVGFWSKIGQKIWNPAFTAVLASLLTFILMWNFNIFTGNENNSSLASNPAVSNNDVNSNNVNTNNSDSRNQIADVKSEPEVKIVYVTKYVNSETTDNLPSSNAELTAKEEETTDRENVNLHNQISFNSFDNVKLQPIKNRLNNSATKEFSLIDNFYPEQSKEPALNLQFKMMSGSSYPNIQLPGAEEKFMDNFSIGAFAPVSNIFQIGLEAGKEPFGMEFYDIDDKSKRLYNIKQNPTLLWAGVGLKMVWDKNIDFLAYSKPYIHFTVASTSVGPLLKSNAGLQFISESGLGILLGFEGSMLAYQHENLWYSSKKLGVVYGVFMRF